MMPGLDRMVSIVDVAVAAQGVAALVLGVAVAYLGRRFGQRHALLWAAGLGALAVALAAWELAPRAGAWCRAVFLVGQWGFLACLAGGCRELARELRFDRRWFGWAAAPATVLAIVATVRAPGDAQSLYARAALLVALGAGYAGTVLGAVPVAGRRVGVLVMRVALAVMTMLYAARVAAQLLHLSPSLTWAGLGELGCLAGLGIGMISCIADEAQRETEHNNAELKKAREELVRLARLDPLTEVFNRHAFHSLIGGVARVHGCVVMVDVMDLDAVYRADGKASGDQAVRASAGAVRRLIRPEDLMFRWAGDQFLVLLPNVAIDMARKRFEGLVAGAQVPARGDVPARHLVLAWGVAAFGEGIPLMLGINHANAALTQHRLARMAAEPPSVSAGGSSSGPQRSR
jgi:diguanylate cyclase (GGDEF)-like protein